MLLETLWSLVARLSKRSSLTTEASTIPALRPSATADVIDPPTTEATAGIVIGPDPRKKDKASSESATTSSTPGIFQNAHDFVVHNPTITQILYSGGLVFHHLAQKSVPGATIDSSFRSYPPRCHPDTRRSLRRRLIKWINDPGRQWRVLWVSGLAAVGKSAIAQTIAEEMGLLGRLGAAFFFSRLNHLDDPEGVVPTLAYQLATLHSQYKQIITQRIVDDPMILEKNLRSQFKALITEPFQVLMTQHPSTIREPLLVVLDGLDECKSKEAQCELIELINAQAQSDGCPLLWMICSRPEWHLKTVFSNADFHVTCGREEVAIDDAEAQQDVARLLQSGFQIIRTRYSDFISGDWPSDGDLRRIAVAASGHLGFASFILRFIDDEEYGNPPGQLEVCIRFLGGSGTPGAINPLHALDLLYHQILSDIPTNILANTMRILGLLILYPQSTLTTQNQANFFGFSQGDFYRLLRQLHSVLYVPPPSAAHEVTTRVYHASFSDYLKDPHRSGRFALKNRIIHFDVAVQCLRWQNSTAQPQPIIEWTCPHNDREDILFMLMKASRAIGWGACCRISDPSIPRLISELERFDFSTLQSFQRAPEHFLDFLSWFYSLRDRNKSLIFAVEETREAERPPAEQTISTLSIIHIVQNPPAYIESAYPGIKYIKSSNGKYSLNFELGKDRQFRVSLKIFRRGPFVCPIANCNAYLHSRFLNRHILSRHGKTPYKCQWPRCSKSFARLNDYENHERLHFEYRSLDCNGCGTQFAGLNALNRHLQSADGRDCLKLQGEKRRTTAISSNASQPSGDTPSRLSPLSLPMSLPTSPPRGSLLALIPSIPLPHYPIFQHLPHPDYISHANSPLASQVEEEFIGSANAAPWGNLSTSGVSFPHEETPRGYHTPDKQAETHRMTTSAKRTYPESGSNRVENESTLAQKRWKLNNRWS